MNTVGIIIWAAHLGFSLRSKHEKSDSVLQHELDGSISTPGSRKCSNRLWLKSTPLKFDMKFGGDAREIDEFLNEIKIQLDVNTITDAMLLY